ncbi:dephospho-CoA kinase [Luteibacter rhizovicinus DSM 16549]|uniref:Dephospho-CoA kinase n=1 Tax=Luteibacter rhizovicinus DSM 16549 TaxID=1440763 RepID=A0A0G9HKK2_9GAMM|nr:dephospho-CoA kinase [Luteibacter rhizovicinus]APG04714.1 dephospho-CoA kinase [Luteibacter rhizovicinus DSM 16549]KLD68207.1 dephospho-CoA kinase [Luteibacter rhizovicinus DSM 16549]
MSGFVVALTGGVASGKSSVERCFEALGVRAYDADVAARAVVEPGSEALAEIARAFGTDALDSDGRLDRPAMRKRVFDNLLARTTLEGILHPRIRAWLHDAVNADTGPYCILSIPLLVENRANYEWVDRVLVVDVPEAIQIERLTRRDGVDEALARKMVAAQASRERRLAIADDVIVNEGSELDLAGKVAELHQSYLGLAAL